MPPIGAINFSPGMKIKLFTIPNLLTLANLLCGSVAAVAALVWGELTLAFGLVVLAAVFDFFDGFVARLLHQSSPIGLQLDLDMGILGVFSYSYDNRYLTDITLRSNGSSQFGKNNRWALFWSAGLGWNIHNEKFLRESKIVKQLKLRGSVGYTGNQNFSDYHASFTFK